MKNRVLGIISMITNLIIAGLVIFGVISFFVPVFSIKMEQPFIQFQVLASCFAGLLALIGVFVYLVVIVKNKPVVPMVFQVFKLMATVALGIVLLTSLVYLLPTYGKAESVYGGANFIFRVIIPILGIASYILVEIHNKMKWRYTLLGILPFIAYAVFYIVYYFVNKNTGAVVDWYEFGLAGGDWLKIVLSGLILLGVTYGLSFVIWLLNKICHLIVFGYEYHDEDIPETPMYSAELVEEQESQYASEPAQEEKVEEASEPVEETKEEEVSKEEKKPAKKSSKKTISSTYGKYDGKARVYHISRSKLIGGQWQVKLAKGEKAIKLFVTQKEAIEYAKKLVRTQGGSIRIHSMKGQIRK